MAGFHVNHHSPLLQGPDVLRFTGKFFHELGWGVEPVNDLPSNLSVVKTSGTLTRGITYSFVSLSTYDGTPPRLHASNIYDIAGQILGFDSHGHPNFSFAAGDQRTTQIGSLLADRRRIIISGIGTVTHVSNQNNQNDDDPMIIELDVQHHNNRTFHHSMHPPPSIFPATQQRRDSGRKSHLFQRSLRWRTKAIKETHNRVTVDHVEVTADLTDTSDDKSSANSS
ncbi:hypothetical protein PSHT_05006 [Puccinia striiformis]|uniref:Uncharacterized protein n=1 Tax=Puccinia striiformis TaxID=27350 RepID=A0A2S4WBH3_9BASI|nr:hypothetical protein PSHT_05006 [Puccinia striiformis]